MSHHLFRIFAIFCALTASLKGQVTVDFPILQDTWANQSKPTRNYGSQTSMIIRHSDVKIPYLQVQTFGITGAITSATLHFRITGDTGSLSAHPVATQTWDESTLSFSNKPSWNATAAGSTSFTNTGWKSVSVTSAITGNGLFSFALISTNLLNADIYSRESAYVPYLRVTFLDQNQAPIANPESYNVLHDTLRTVAAPGVLANDTDPNNDPLTAQLITGPTHGMLNLAADGSFTYLPNPGYSGTDSFTYQAVDNHGPGDSLASLSATVTLNVSADGTQFTAYELARFQEDLGVTLSVDQQLELGAIVKPIPGESWRDAADARINQHRKADLTVTVTDANGVPLQGADVHVKLRRKTFLFGGILDLTEFSLGAPGGVNAAAYRSTVPKFFDAVGLNNGLKPKLSATTPTNLDRLNNEFFPWCSANGMPVRGHLLIWPGGTHMSAAVEAKVVEIENTDTPTQTQLDELRVLVDNEISSWAAQWNTYEWDVLNEPIANHRIQDILGANETVRWFQLAQAARPGAGRLINEYQIISGNNEARFPAYKTEIQRLLDNAGPITGIGFQSRFKFKREDPGTIYSRLEQFTSYNMNLVGTEFEVIANPDGSFTPDENLRARMTEEVMTNYFSHPKVTGLHAWEYLSDLPSALVSNNGTPKLNGLVWYYLNRLRYDTRTTLVTDAQGQVALRGFKGDYEITVNAGGDPVIETLTLTADSQIQIGSSLVASQTHTLDVIADSFVQEGANANTNFGNNTEVHLRTPDGTNGRLGYLKFNLAGVDGIIQSAKLKLHSTTEPQAVQALAVADNSWLETGTGGITWNNRPPTGALLGSAAPTAVGTVFEIPLDAAAVAAAFGGQFSIALNETGNSFGKLASRNNTSSWPVPQLVITTGSPDSDGDGIFDSLDPDDDNDGIPDEAENAYGMNPLNSADGTSDNDHDGITAIIEHRLGLNPAVPNNLAESFRIEPAADGKLLLTIRHRTGDHNPAPELLCWDGTGGWQPFDPLNPPLGLGSVVDSETTVSGDSLGSMETHVHTLQPQVHRLFFRLALEVP